MPKPVNKRRSHKTAYTQASVKNALEAVQKGLSIYKASLQYRIPKTTLLYKYQGIRPVDAKPGAPTVLTMQEERTLADWIIQLGKSGFPVTKIQLLDSVTMLIKNLERPNPFKDGRPGRAWLQGFLARHGEISLRIAQSLQKHRSIVTEQSIRKWFDEVRGVVSKNDLLNTPARTFNCDETAFYLSPTEDRVLVASGSKQVHRITPNDTKENYTVLITANAEGLVCSKVCRNCMSINVHFITGSSTNGRLSL